MGSSVIFRCLPVVCFTVLFAIFCGAPALQAQGGEPLYFAIRGAKVVPVSGPPLENATVVYCLPGPRRFFYRCGDSRGSCCEW